MRCEMDIQWLLTVIESWAFIALQFYVFSFIRRN